MQRARPSLYDYKNAMTFKALVVMAAALAFAAGPLVVPFDGFDPTLFPVPQIDPPAQPAGYAFAIWGPIYLLLLVHAGFGLFARTDDPDWDRVRWPLAGSLLPGALWLPIAQVSPVFATLLIWIMLATALTAFVLTPKREDWALLRLPLGLYAGWLTAASAVSVALLGAGYDVGPQAQGWAVIALVLALGIAVTVHLFRPEAVEYAAAVIWALVAVVVANWGSSFPIAILAGAGALGLTALTLRPAVHRWRARRDAPPL